MFITILYLVGGLAVLIFSAERFIFGAAAVARHYRVSPLLIGILIVGFGTSAPEIMVSSISALQGNAGLSIGNAIGSNISNIGLILGIAALLRPVEVHSSVIRRELPILLAAVLAAWALLSNGNLDRIEGALLLVAFCVMVYWIGLVALRQRGDGPDILELEVAVEMPPEEVSQRTALFWLLAGLVLLLVSSRVLVWAAVEMAVMFGVSDLVIGLTVVAVGTSLPELAAAVSAAIKREDDLVIGNIVGSNTFNTLAVLGLPGLIAPGPFPAEVLTRDVPVMVVLTLVLFAMAYGFRGGPARVTRAEGALLVVAFSAYQWTLMVAT